MLNSLEVCLGQTWALWAALPNGFCQEARVFPSPRSGLCENSCLFELWARTECFWFVFYPWNILLRTKFLGKGENLLQILEEIKRKMLATRLNSFWTDHFPRKNPNIFLSESSCPAGNSWFHGRAALLASALVIKLIEKPFNWNCFQNAEWAQTWQS